MLEAISVMEMERYLGKPYVLLVDLRDRESYDEFHIPGAIHLPYEKVEKRTYCLPQGYLYLLYCERGGLSLQAARILSAAGFEAKTIIGGMTAYEERHRR